MGSSLSKAMGAVGAPAKTRVKPVSAVLQIVQRLRVGQRGIRMIDPLHDLPGDGGGPPAIGAASRARG